MDEGNVKLVPSSESASNDKNIETIYQPPDSQLRVIKEKSDNVNTSSLDSAKRQINAEQLDADEQTVTSSEKDQVSNTGQDEISETAVEDEVKLNSETIEADMVNHEMDTKEMGKEGRTEIVEDKKLDERNLTNIGSLSSSQSESESESENPWAGPTYL